MNALNVLPLVIFLIILINYLMGAVFITYHLSKFGIGSKPRAIMIVFLAGLALLLFLNFFFFFQVKWEGLIPRLI